MSIVKAHFNPSTLKASHRVATGLQLAIQPVCSHCPGTTPYQVDVSLSAFGYCGECCNQVGFSEKITGHGNIGGPHRLTWRYEDDDFCLWDAVITGSYGSYLGYQLQDCAGPADRWNHVLNSMYVKVIKDAVSTMVTAHVYPTLIGPAGMPLVIAATYVPSSDCLNGVANMVYDPEDCCQPGAGVPYCYICTATMLEVPE